MLKVISISGPPGSGKSSLALALAQAFDCPVVGYDDFEVMTSWPMEAVAAWLDDGAPMSAVRAPGLREAILRHEECVIFETPFGRTCPIAGDLVSLSIWLDCPDDVALARKLGALAEAAGDDPGFAPWLAGWLTAYTKLTRRALQIQRERVRDCADFCLNAGEDAKTVANLAIMSVKNALFTK